MSKKYEITKEKHSTIEAYRIKALIDFGDVKVGDLGGFIEIEENLSQSGSAWVYGDAVVYNNGVILDDSIVKGTSIVSETTVSGKSVIKNTIVSPKTIVMPDDTELVTVGDRLSIINTGLYFKFVSTLVMGGVVKVMFGPWAGTVDQFEKRCQTQYKSNVELYNAMISIIRNQYK
jgi:hypothetical protein